MPRSQAAESVGLSAEIAELIAGELRPSEAETWWADFWAPITDDGEHWLAKRKTYQLSEFEVRTSDLAFVYDHRPLEAGETTSPDCGHSNCVKHLRVVAECDARAS